MSCVSPGQKDSCELSCVRDVSLRALPLLMGQTFVYMCGACSFYLRALLVFMVHEPHAPTGEIPPTNGEALQQKTQPAWFN